MKIKFYYDEERFRSFNEIIVKNWISKICSLEKKIIGKIIYHFVCEDKILEINTQFLNHSFYTDIITFDSSLVNIINGEIFISPDTVLSNSKKFNTIFDQEMHRVIIHGIMHLCGYTDSSEEEKMLMRKKENFCLTYLEKL